MHFPRMSHQKDQEEQSCHLTALDLSDEDAVEEFEDLNQIEKQTSDRCMHSCRNLSADSPCQQCQPGNHSKALSIIQDLSEKLVLENKKVQELAQRNSTLCCEIQDYQNEIKNLHSSQHSAEEKYAKLLKEYNDLKDACSAAVEKNKQHTTNISCLEQKIRIYAESQSQIKQVLHQLIQTTLGRGQSETNYSEILASALQKQVNTRKISSQINNTYSLIANSKTQDKHNGVGEELQKIEKIKAAVFKYQDKLTAQREYIFHLEKQVEKLRDGTGIADGLKKWFDPVMKFCKAEELGQQSSGKADPNSKSSKSSRLVSQTNIKNQMKKKS